MVIITYNVDLNGKQLHKLNLSALIRIWHNGLSPFTRPRSCHMCDLCLNFMACKGQIEVSHDHDLIFKGKMQNMIYDSSSVSITPFLHGKNAYL